MTYLSDRAMRRLRDMATWPDLEGTRYTAVEEVGRGGMGTVYRAQDAVLGRDVALKVINAAGEHAALAARLEQEARVLASLEHPGIVPVHDAGILPDGRAYYVMKLVRGVSLDVHLAGIETIDGRLRVFERICEPVAFAHASGVVHRDLKPANVMVGPFGEVLVLDWGLAKRASGRPETDPLAAAGGAPELPLAGGRSAATQAGTIIGTPGFMAPEQASPGAAVDARADVHALGALLLFMLAAADPASLSSATPDSLLRRQAVPKRLRAICAKAMARSSAERYADAAALADDVARFRAGLPVAAHRETALDRLSRFAARHRTPILLVLGYLIMRVLVAAYVAFNPPVP